MVVSRFNGGLIGVNGGWIGVNGGLIRLLLLVAVGG